MSFIIKLLQYKSASPSLPTERRLRGAKEQMESMGRTTNSLAE